jgi:diaminopropionate ammonia-lyase
MSGGSEPLVDNPHASRGAYPEALRRILNATALAEHRRWLTQWNEIASPTPLYELDSLAQRLGLARISLKDESVRTSLGSFKILGAPLALVRLIQRLRPELDADEVGLLRGVYAAALGAMTVISATDGNHGRALAAAARALGVRCCIVLHAEVSAEREDPIAALGASIVRVAGNYDESVRHAARLAAERHWWVVSDTSYEGYEDIPRDVMQGYAILAAEVMEQNQVAGAAACPYTHVFLQGGVGGLAASIGSYFWESFGAQRPSLVVVEPVEADCLRESARHGRPSAARGSVNSVMAGLACGEPSPLAWRFLEGCGDHFLTVSDADAVKAMQRLATGDGDVPLVAGASGAAGAAGLLAASLDAAQRAALGLDAHSRVLLVNTEGATAPGEYARQVGETAQAVRARQMAWILSG